jgi:ubiquinone/menaquinone biosynthesis C-methylase UbiE
LEENLEEYWARFIDPAGRPGLNYWEYFAERIAELAALRMGTYIFDLGTYDGNVLFKAMARINAQGHGVGTDIYYGGFQEGAVEAKQRGWEEKISFVQSDANALGFHEGVFHTVLSNFIGLDDCFDFERLEFIKAGNMMSEICRVLKPGGQVGIGSWVKQGDIDWIINRFRKYLPEHDEQISCYSKENPEGHKLILQKYGFKDIDVYVEHVDFISPDPETWWRQMRQAAKECFRQVSDPKRLEIFKRKVFADLGQFQISLGIHFSKTVSFAFGTKPDK